MDVCYCQRSGQQQKVITLMGAGNKERNSSAIIPIPTTISSFILNLGPFGLQLFEGISHSELDPWPYHITVNKYCGIYGYIVLPEIRMNYDDHS